MLTSAIVGLIYISIQKRFDFTAVRGLVMALAYVWGLILAIYLMGHGLVSLPRSLYRRANVANYLRRIQSHAPKVHDRLTDAVNELEDLEDQLSQLQRRKTGSARDFADWIEELAEYSMLSDARPFVSQSIIGSNRTVPAVITERYMADLSRRLQRARHKKARFVDEWDRLVQSASDCQTILNSAASQKLDFGRPASDASFWSRLQFLSPYLRYQVYVHLLPTLRIVLAVLLAGASACIVWSELVKAFAPQISVISVTIVPHPNEPGQIGFGGQIVASFWLLYMCAAALFGVKDAKVWGNRALVRRNTYGESACWYASQVARLTVPLSYNFLTFLPNDVRRQTTFYKFLGEYIDLTPLGKGFDYFFPMFILLPICATLFNLYGRIQQVFGFDMIEDDEDENGDNPAGFGVGGWREGRELIERELNGMGSLGLASRTRDPEAGGTTAGSNLSSSRRGAPTIWVPPAERSRATANGPTRTFSPRPTAIDEEERDENMFQAFAHRVRNTFETANMPQWLQGDLPQFQRPRWMNSDGASDGETGRTNSVGFFDRVFGGSSSGGRVQL